MKKRVSPKSIAEVVSSSPVIQKLRQEAKKLERLQGFIDSFLEPEVAKRLHVGSQGSDFIVLIAESSAWAAKIRYLVPVILQNLATQPEYATINTVRIRTEKNDRPAPYTPEIRRLALGKKAASALEESSELIEDPEIAAALRRLGRHSP